MAPWRDAVLARAGERGELRHSPGRSERRVAAGGVALGGCAARPLAVIKGRVSMCFVYLFFLDLGCFVHFFIRFSIPLLLHSSIPPFLHSFVPSFLCSFFFLFLYYVIL